MGRKKAEEITDGLLRLNKLTADDVRKCYITGIDSQELGGLELTGSWKQLFEALLSTLYRVNTQKFISRLYEAKILDAEIEVAPQEYVIRTGPEPVYASQILGTPFYLYFNSSPEKLPYKLRQLATLLKVNPKDMVLNLTPYSYVDQDTLFFKINKSVHVRMLRLAETVNTGFNHNKMLAVEVFKYKAECNTFLELVAHVLYYISGLDKEWFSRVIKYNKETVLKIAKNKEEAALYDIEPRAIGDTGCYVTERLNADEIMTYLRDICKEFSINMNEVKLYYRDIDINRLNSGLRY